MPIPAPVEFWTLNDTLVGAVAGNLLVSGDGQDHYIPGKVGQAIQGDGVARWWRLAGSAINPANGTITVACWIRVPILSASAFAVTLVNGTRYMRVHQVGFTTRLTTKSGIFTRFVSGGSVNSDGEWHLIIATWRPGAVSPTHQIWVDNVYGVGSVNWPLEQTWSGTTDVVLCATTLAGADKSNCDVDCVGIWLRELTNAERDELYNSGNGWEYEPAPPADNTPDAFDFTDVSGADPSTAYISDSEVITGMDAGTPVSVTGGEYRINGGAWTAAAGTIDPGDTLELRATSSAESEGVVTVVVTVGTLSVDWTITTGILYSVVSNMIGSSICECRILRSRIVRGWL